MWLANNGHRTSTLIEFSKTVNGIDSSSFANDGERSKALLAAYALVSRLESPWEAVSRIAMAQPALAASLKIAKDLGLFEAWEAEKDKPKTSKELAEMVSCDTLLLDRILRHMAASNVLEEIAPGTFKQSAFTMALLDPVFGEWINYLYDATLPCFEKLPEYLKMNNYKSPMDPTDGIFQYAKGSKGSLFDYYDVNPRESKTFNDIMGGVMSRQASWLDIYPHEKLFGPDAGGASSQKSVILVDVGGNVGRDLERFRAVHPEQAARLVLQDRAEVIRESICPDPVQRMAHDFFEPQPIKGAHAYYMHGIIHDWADEQARKILSNLKEAMTPGFSKLLIHDHVIPEGHAHLQATALDLTMMVKVAALERSEAMWQELLAPVGLRIVKIWNSSLATQSIIEAEVA